MVDALMRINLLNGAELTDTQIKKISKYGTTVTQNQENSDYGSYKFSQRL